MRGRGVEVSKTLFYTFIEIQKMMKNLDKIRGEDERENNQSSEYKCCCQCRFTRNGIDHDRSGNWIKKKKR